jgi:hypothetical protein
MRPLFDGLVDQLSTHNGVCEIVSLPCCIHLFGDYDFVAVLPRKHHLEIRFALPQELTNPRVKRAARISKGSFKHCVDIAADEDVDEELLGWLRAALPPHGHVA